MPKVTIEVPEGFEEVVKELEQTLQRAQKGVEGAKAGDLEGWDAAWQSVNAGVEESERQMKRRLLRVPDVEAPEVLINGRLHKRLEGRSGGGRVAAGDGAGDGAPDGLWHLAGGREYGPSVGAAALQPQQLLAGGVRGGGAVRQPKAAGGNSAGA
jgi:hypothetical protein